MKHLFRPAASLLLLLTLIGGILYPLLVTLLAQWLFPWQANGSLLRQGATVVGSQLIGQPFSGNRYFWSRPSATTPLPYDAASSAGSNLGPGNPALVAAVRARLALLRAAHPDQAGPVPLDLLTSSASGLDPHISPAAARYQLTRVARARNLSVAQVQQQVQAATSEAQWWLFGAARVNVLQLNLALDGLRPALQ